MLIAKLRFDKFCSNIFAAPLQSDPNEPAFQFIIKWDFQKQYNESNYSVFLFTFGSDECYYPMQKLSTDDAFSLVNDRFHWILKQSEVEKDSVVLILLVIHDEFKFPELNPAGVYRKSLKTFERNIIPYSKIYCKISPNKLWKRYLSEND